MIDRWFQNDINKMVARHMAEKYYIGTKTIGSILA